MRTQTFKHGTQYIALREHRYEQLKYTHTSNVCILITLTKHTLHYVDSVWAGPELQPTWNRTHKLPHRITKQTTTGRVALYRVRAHLQFLTITAQHTHTNIQ